ncbi:protease Do-like 8, chloroplastic isoform X1 [Phoenix dactylifera]|uniref:Protease Do-like 8, chloroplastic isoform X1 n=1 Tax=Phoenix dactylifera TaxID=42345 RepID=A0A8B7BS58_PHODC|nr:protease Do-like 8, chloroplastic isoform X1 [Phoenix dactylifera]XP_008784264.2 protease Do-like 8, chloroplastic isoform X1 [Phoenix dactylifera]XP_026658986.2 protease Do-like 8, chloroplastic isoform X1 [Phoenix dactylifera]
MHVLACNPSPQPQGRRAPSHFGRRKIFSDSISSICSQRSTSFDSSVDETSCDSQSLPRPVGNQTINLGKMLSQIIPWTTRRMLFASPAICLCFHSSRYFTAVALGDPSVTVQDVTPRILPSGPLFPSEERIVELFERNTYSVVNIFDVTLRPQLNVTGVVEVPEGNGSGVVWDNDGHIVTNYHVVGNALSKNPSPGQVVARVNILASDGVQKNFEGKLIGADRAKDLAVLKVEASADLLKSIKVGQSSALKVGQQCLAIGNPFGFDHTLTVGVISGLNRDIFSQTGVTIGGGIQTDAAINPGNSGGPLLDSKGNLIGINTAIFTQTGTSAGVGFAIPSSTVLKIVPQLIQFGKVVRAGLNVEIASNLVANQLNVQKGALVLQVMGNSVAAKVGLLPTTRGFAGNIILGDVIVAVDDKPIRSKADLSKILDDYNVGDKVVLKVQRGNQSLELPLVLEETSIR